MPGNLLFLTRNEGRAAVRVRSSALSRNALSTPLRRMGKARVAEPVIRALEMPTLVRRDSDVIAPDVGHAGRYA